PSIRKHAAVYRRPRRTAELHDLTFPGTIVPVRHSSLTTCCGRRLHSSVRQVLTKVPDDWSSRTFAATDAGSQCNTPAGWNVLRRPRCALASSFVVVFILSTILDRSFLKSVLSIAPPTFRRRVGPPAGARCGRLVQCAT